MIVTDDQCPRASIFDIANETPDRLRSQRSAVPILPRPTLTFTARDAQLYDRWSPGRLLKVIEDQDWYYRFGYHGSKRDIARSLDPVTTGLVTEARVKELFDA